MVGDTDTCTGTHIRIATYMGEIRSKGFPVSRDICMGQPLRVRVAHTQMVCPYAYIGLDSYCKCSGKILVWDGILTLNQAPRPITISLSYKARTN